MNQALRCRGPGIPGIPFAPAILPPPHLRALDRPFPGHVPLAYRHVFEVGIEGPIELIRSVRIPAAEDVPAAVLLPVGGVGGHDHHPVAGPADVQQSGEPAVHLDLVAPPEVDIQLRPGDPPPVQGRQ